MILWPLHSQVVAVHFQVLYFSSATIICNADDGHFWLLDDLYERSDTSFVRSSATIDFVHDYDRFSIEFLSFPILLFSKLLFLILLYKVWDGRTLWQLFKHVVKHRGWTFVACIHLHDIVAQFRSYDSNHRTFTDARWPRNYARSRIDIWSTFPSSSSDHRYRPQFALYTDFMPAGQPTFVLFDDLRVTDEIFGAYWLIFLYP